ncbi:hypothetical protein AAFF_G00439410 [Aldrovandia affinis]|uniref:Uncharacterized protein n=1 Tax=Aldrovandia affinis TaxID=143900 RepID=A0AAD7WHQ3_9TELE|nr:hypothetical protein AAFF_G00439410 [Aldrovandia affinis]
MSNCVPFHTQLASIMEVLAKAAVAEICELVDDSYAVLHLEISRKQKENEALKKKLHMMEMRIARGAIQKTRAREGSVDSRSDCVQVYSELMLRGTSIEDNFPTVEGLFGKQSSLSLWRDGETTSVSEEPSSLQSVVREESSGIEGEGPESLLIKEERLEEDLKSSDSQRGLNTREERAVESDGGERAPILDTQTVDTPTAPEELIEQHRTRHKFLEDRRLDTVLKAEPEIKTVNPQDTAGRPNSLGNEYVLYERPGELDTFFTQKTIETVTGGPACSYTAKTNSESLSAHTEPRLSPTTAKDADKTLSSLGTLNGMDSLPFDVEAGMHSAWNKDVLSEACDMQYRGLGHTSKIWAQTLIVHEVSNSGGNISPEYQCGRSSSIYSHNREF